MAIENFPNFHKVCILTSFIQFNLSIIPSFLTPTHPPVVQGRLCFCIGVCMIHIYIAYTYIYVMLMFLRSLDRLFSTCLSTSRHCHKSASRDSFTILLSNWPTLCKGLSQSCMIHEMPMTSWHDSHNPCWPSSLAKLNNFWYLLWLLCCLSNWRTPPKKCNLGSRDGLRSGLLTVGV